MNNALSSEDVAKGLSLTVATSPLFSPDGKTLTFLYPDSTGKRQLFAIDLSTDLSNKEANTIEPYQVIDLASVMSNLGELSLEEQLRRERMRLFASGIVSYEWIHNANNHSVSKKLLIPLNGQILVFILNPGQLTEAHMVYDGSLGAAIDPHISPDGNKIGFALNNNLYYQYLHFQNIDIGSEKGCKLLRVSKPVQLTTEGSKEGFSCGLADYLAQEEMNRFRGFWWSPDSASILYCVNDESHVPHFEILHQGKSNPKHSEQHRYPFAGERNGVTKLFCVTIPPLSNCWTRPCGSTEDFQVVDVKHDEASIPVHCELILVEPVGGVSKVAADDYYLARAGWWPDGSVMAQVENRDQTVLELLQIDPITGGRTVLLTEESDVWINLHDLLHTMSPAYSPKPDSPLARESFGLSPESVNGCDSDHTGDFYFIWASERSGYRQLYLYKFDATLKSAVNLLNGKCIGPDGHFVVDAITYVDETTETLYFTASLKSALEQHLYSVSFANAGESALQISTTAGWHNVTVDARAGVYLDIHSSVDSPYLTTLVSLSDSKTVTIYDERSKLKSSFGGVLQVPIFKTIRSSDDQVDLHCVAYFPPKEKFGDTGPFPTIVSVYGGPSVQRVYNQISLTGDLRAQRLARDGYLVIKCDNRGSSRRGIQFEGAIKWNMGDIEVQDQVAALRSYGDLVNKEKVGMFGWSYGGYMSAISLCRAPDVFRCSVAGAPVSSWDGYDTHYTERYMGRPQVNEEGYKVSSVMNWMEGMTGRLMLVHGLIDENVHFRHTARLINSLIEHRKRHELILFPCERHAPHKIHDRIFLEDRMTEFLNQNLLM